MEAMGGNGWQQQKQRMCIDSSAKPKKNKRGT
jgi:hypothetical protein